MKKINLTHIAFILISLLSGYFFLQVLISPPLQMPLHSSVLSLLIVGGIVLSIKIFGSWRSLIAVPLFLPGFIVGYLVGTFLFLRPLPHTPAPIVELPNDTAKEGFTAVIYFTHGEPPTYEKAIPAWKHTIQEMDKDGVPFIPYPLRPLFFNAIRTEFLEAGGSHHNAIHNRTMLKLEQMMLSSYPDLRFYLSFIDDHPHPNEAASQAVRDGASKIILAHVFLTESSHTQEGEEMVAELNLEQHGIPVCTTYPLWNSDHLIQMFVQQTEQMRRDMPREKVGVLLVAHGQSPEADEIYPKQTKQETDFRLAIRSRLVEQGYPSQNVSLAWMEFREPTPQDGLRSLLKEGVELVLVYSSSISAEGIHSTYEIPEMLSEVELPAGVRMVNLGAWNDHPLVLQAIAERIEACLNP